MKESLAVLAVSSLLCLLPARAAESQPQHVLTWTTGSTQARGIALDASGNVYIGDTGDGRLKKYDSDGNLLASWGTFGTLPGQFWGIVGLAIDSNGNIYTGEGSVNRRVQEFDASFNFITMWSVFTFGIDVGSNGNVYVVSAGPDVFVYSSAGRWIMSWDGLQIARGIAVDTQNNVYVVDNYSRVVKFDSQGTLLTEWPTLPIPFDVDVDASGKVYVAEGGYEGAARAAMFTADGQLLARWGEGLFNDPRGIAVDPPGTNIYVLDAQGIVFKFISTTIGVQPNSWSAVKNLYRE